MASKLRRPLEVGSQFSTGEMEAAAPSRAVVVAAAAVVPEAAVVS